MIKFDPQTEVSNNIIKVIGVGGGGCNAINHMYKQDIKGVDFVVVNTDEQALSESPVPQKIRIGEKITEGLGAGAKPPIGREAAIENVESIRKVLDDNTKMVFITAGLGGGTGTGAAPIIAATAKEMGILTVGIVTLPFNFEGKRRRIAAEHGVEELRKNVDSILLICNEKLRELHGNLKLSEAFAEADNVLTIAAKGIAEIITTTGGINVDFNDVFTVMNNSGVAIMGSGYASGENRAMEVAEQALNSPLLNDNDIDGASNILLYIASGADEVSMDEVMEITDYIQEAAGDEADIIWGTNTDSSLGDALSITLIATGFKSETKIVGEISGKRPEKKVNHLDVSKTINTPRAVVEPKKEEIQIELIKQKSVVENQIENENVTEVSNAAPTIVFSSPSQVVNQMNSTEMEAQSENKVDTFEVIEESDPDENGIILKTIQPNASNQLIQEERIEEVQKEMNEISQNRKSILKGYSTSFGQLPDFNKIENEPAYKRKNIVLEEGVHSSENEMSRLNVDQSSDDNVRDIPYVHDTVD